MTVGELIAILAELDDDLPVMVSTRRTDGTRDGIREVWVTTGKWVSKVVVIEA
jgi:hypothetical protein